jgi:outer membrane protein OmpA-like peptidoglycan-associated protein
MRRLALPVAWCTFSTAALVCVSPALSVRADDAAPAAAVGGDANAATSGDAKVEAKTSQAASSAKPGGKTEAELDARDREWDLRAGTTYLGPAGGIYVLDAGSAAAPSFRLQAITDFFIINDYLYNEDKARYVGSALALSITPIKYLEFSAAFNNRSARNSRTTPTVLQSIGDLTFDVKAWGEPTRGLTIGGDALLAFRSGPDQLGFDASGTSIGLRANMSLDLRKMTQREAPLILRLNIGYFFDNSAKMVKDIEDKRFENLKEDGITNVSDPSDEYRHLVRRDERLAFNINRVDQLQFALGLEVPLKPHPKFAIHPIVEWQLGVPVNRQGFDCPYVTKAGTDQKLGGTDSCLAEEGVDTYPQSITAGVRMYPGNFGLNILLAGQLGVGGSTNFVQELAPNAPYRVILAAGYTADLGKKEPEVIIKEVEKPVPVNTAPELGHVRGTIVESGSEGIVVANARVSFPGRSVTDLVTGPDGAFTSYPFPPGDVQVAVEAEGYEAGTCASTIPAGGGDVSLACMITALPRIGRATLSVFDDKGAPATGVNVVVVGPDTKSLPTDSDGRVKISELKPGEYRTRIDANGYLPSVTTFVVKVREESVVSIQLIPVPKSASVKIVGDAIKVKGTIYFAPNTAQIEARSTPLLVEIASVMMAHPELLQVEVQGHTDDTGAPGRNSQLSEERAAAVKDSLSKAGVERDRLLAKGYGAEKPVAPNVTEKNRAKNRRVEFVILQRAGK